MVRLSCQSGVWVPSNRLSLRAVWTHGPMAACAANEYVTAGGTYCASPPGPGYIKWTYPDLVAMTWNGDCYNGDTWTIAVCAKR